MRNPSFVLLAALLLAPIAAAEEKQPKKVEAVSDEDAEQALAAFKEAYKEKDLGAKQTAVYDLHDVPNDLVIKQLAKLLKKGKPEVRNVAAMALGGQGHNVDRAGKTLLSSFDSNYKHELVVAATLDGWRELRYFNYWPKLDKCLDDDRAAVSIRALDLLGSNKDFRAFEKILKMYKEAVPKGHSWDTGPEVTVDTGAAGDADQRAAEAKWKSQNAGKGGGGGGGGGGKKNIRNLAQALRRCMRNLTGEDFEQFLDLEDWYVENYVSVHRKIAEQLGKNPDAAAKKAERELPDYRAKVEERRRREEEAAARRAAQKAKKKS